MISVWRLVRYMCVLANAMLQNISINYLCHFQYCDLFMSLMFLPVSAKKPCQYGNMVRVVILDCFTSSHKINVEMLKNAPQVIRATIYRISIYIDYISYNITQISCNMQKHFCFLYYSIMFKYCTILPMHLLYKSSRI